MKSSENSIFFSMTYAELIKLLEPYAGKEVFFNGYENTTTTEVHFYAGANEPILELSRRWGKDEVTIK